MIRCLFLALALMWTSPALSEEVFAQYYAWLGQQDVRNSSGKKLTSFGAVIAQDRANYHRFGNRHQLDESDPLFSDRQMRANIARWFKAGRRVESHIVQDVLNGEGHYVIVRVLGRNGRITHIDVWEGAG